MVPYHHPNVYTVMMNVSCCRLVTYKSTRAARLVSSAPRPAVCVELERSVAGQPPWILDYVSRFRFAASNKNKNDSRCVYNQNSLFLIAKSRLTPLNWKLMLLDVSRCQSVNAVVQLYLLWTFTLWFAISVLLFNLKKAVFCGVYVIGQRTAPWLLHTSDSLRKLMRIPASCFVSASAE